MVVVGGHFSSAGGSFCKMAYQNRNFYSSNYNNNSQARRVSTRPMSNYYKNDNVPPRFRNREDFLDEWDDSSLSSQPSHPSFHHQQANSNGGRMTARFDFGREYQADFDRFGAHRGGFLQQRKTLLDTFIDRNDRYWVSRILPFF